MGNFLMDQTKLCGTQSLHFQRPAYILSAASVAGKKEAEGPLGKKFDMVDEQDNRVRGKDLGRGREQYAERSLYTGHRKSRTETGEDPVSVRGRSSEAGDCHFHGSGGTADSHVRALRGMFNIRRGTGTGSNECVGRVWRLYAAVTSSHFGSAEKEFRFPLGYASQRPLSAHWTVTGSGAFVVGTDPGNVKISGITVGKIVDYGLKDSQNMGACMAPAAADTIVRNLKDFGRTAEDYDRIITGDLGSIGQSILFDLAAEKGYDLRQKHLDCGMLIFDPETQDYHAGGSGLWMCGSDRWHRICCQRLKAGNGKGFICPHRSIDVNG